MYHLLIREFSTLPAVCIYCFIFFLELSENNFFRNIDNFVFEMNTEFFSVRHVTLVIQIFCFFTEVELMIPGLWRLGSISALTN
jgi:hypothetical protein